MNKQMPVSSVGHLASNSTILKKNEKKDEDDDDEEKKKIGEKYTKLSNFQNCQIWK